MNHATEHFLIWLENDRYPVGAAREIIADARLEEPDMKHAGAEQLKEWFEEVYADRITEADDTPGVIVDLLRVAMSQIEWAAVVESVSPRDDDQ